MEEDAGVYDLGEIHLGEGRATLTSSAPRRRAAPTDSGRHPRPRFAHSGPSVGPGLAGSLSMFVPGAGQMIAGELTRGLFFLSTSGFAVATAYAVLATLDRLLPTLDLLGVRRFTVSITLAAAALAAMSLHVGSVVHAHALRDHASGSVPHPIVAGLASGLVPGWGQVLLGHRVRAGLFLAMVWIVGLAWLAMTPAGTSAARELGIAVPPGARDGWGPVALVAAPILIWTLAVYDAAAGAAASRR